MRTFMEGEEIAQKSSAFNLERCSSFAGFVKYGVFPYRTIEKY